MNVRAPGDRATETRERIRSVEPTGVWPNLKLGASGENIYLADAVVTAIITAFIIELIERTTGTDL